MDVQKKYNLPTEVKFCKKCVISNQRPRIRFDENGVCGACNFAEKKKGTDWQMREKELKELLDRFRSKDGSYDVIVPCSGGKDSSYVAHQLKYVYGMNPLCITWSPLLYTDIGWQNLQNFIKSGFDHMLFSPNGRVNRILAKLGFELIGDPFQPFIYGVKSYPIRMAIKYRIPLIMYGENGEVEYGGSSDNEEKPSHNTSSDVIKHYFSGISPEAFEEQGISSKDLLPYSLPSQEEADRVGVECHFYGYYKNWTPQENFYYAQKHTGFQANPDGRSEGTYSKYASLDDRTDGFHYYLSYIKFGIGRVVSDAAHEIRDGHITREEGVALVNKFNGEFPKKYFKDFLEYCDISEKRFWEVIDSFRSPHLWEQVDGEWKLKYKVR